MSTYDPYSYAMGRLIRKKRIAAGLTQAQVAKAINVAQPAVSSWEKGKTAPTLANVVRLVDLLSISDEELVATIRRAA